MFPAFSAANYWLHFFLSLLRCFRCPHQGLQTQPAGEGCTSGLAREQDAAENGPAGPLTAPSRGQGLPVRLNRAPQYRLVGLVNQAHLGTGF